MASPIHRNCQYECQLLRASSVINRAEMAIQKAEEIERRGKVQEMSAARWCDLGEHSFSPRDKQARRRIEEYEVDGTMLREELEICGPCQAAAKVAAVEQSAGKDQPKGIEK